MSYIDLGYNEFLTAQATDAPQQLDPLQASLMVNDLPGENITTTIRGTLVGQGINASNITTGYMKFDRARGGTLQLGGKDNGNGVMELYSEADLLAILMNKDGITINGGALTVKNAQNQSVLDGDGLVSTAAFQGDTKSLTGTITTTSSVMGDVAGLSHNIILSRPARVLVFFSVTGSNDGIEAGQQQLVRAVANSSIISVSIRVSGIPTNVPSVVDSSASWVGLISLPAGMNVVKLQHRQLSGGNASLKTDSNIGYVILGK